MRGGIREPGSRRKFGTLLSASSAALAAAALTVAVLSLASPGPRPAARAPRRTGSLPEAPGAVFSLAAVRPLTILACGDVLLSRTVADRVSRYGYQWPFRNVRDLVSGADIAFCNLENPASFLGRPWLGKPENVTFRADPGALFGLKWAGFDAVSLANNHIYDYGPDALRETLEYLDLLGIARAGAGLDGESASAPAVVVRGGARVAFLAYAQEGIGVPPAGEKPGAAPADISRLAGDIARARTRERADYVIVSVHWGDEHQGRPGAFQREFGRAAIDAGAAAVLGHHPHVLQSLEAYGTGVIAYSLGNFVFDMAADATYDTAALRFTLAGGRVREVEILPLRIERYDYAPRPATSREAERILSALRDSSRHLGTDVEIAEGRGYIRLAEAPGPPQTAPGAGP